MTQAVRAQGNVPTGAHFSDTTISGATSFPVPSDAAYVLIQAVDQAVWLRVDGGTAAANSGFKIPANEAWRIEVIPNGSISVIEAASGGSVQGQWLSS